MAGIKFVPKLFFLSAILSGVFAAVANPKLLSSSTRFDPAEVSLLNQYSSLAPSPSPFPDTPATTLPYPIKDRTSDYYTNNPNNKLDLKDPKAINKTITYDPITGEFIIIEKIGDRFYRDPNYLSFEEFLNQEYKRSNQEYWQQRAEGVNLLGRSEGIQLAGESETLDRLFGGSNVEIRPKGNIELKFGGTFQNVENPTLPERARKNGGFDFDMNINMSVLGKIGEKLKLTTNYNTQATFEFENQVKIEYTGYEDEIIQSIEAGNVSFPLSTTLINGSQSLFGIKSELKFGRLTWTNLLSQQKSKRENIKIEGGAQTRDFAIEVDQYDENRHFFLSQYFRDNYNHALSTLPIINSPIVISKVEVWVTNTVGITENTRDIVGFMDLAEHDKIYHPLINPLGNLSIPSNSANDLFGKLTSTSGTRGLDQVIKILTDNSGPFQMQAVRDFEKTRARKLSPQEYTLYPQLGFVSLNQQLKPDEVLAVAFEFTYLGQVYRVGEFSQDVPVDPTNPTILFLKMLKSTSARPNLPIWDLMMKNIYALGAYQVSPEDFRLDVYYKDPGGGKKRYLPQGPDNIKGKPLLQLTRMDSLNSQRDRNPDGLFDFIRDVTINPNNGRVIFTVVEPFGDYLRQQFNGDPAANQFVFDYLYDSTKTIALQFPQFNRYTIEGSYKSSVSSEIYLGAFNIPQNSVTVSAGGTQLVEGRDYTVDYNLGRVKIINDGILNSGVPINVSFENNALFGFNQKTLIANRFDYWINDNFTIGATHMHLSERPYTQKVNFGDDPISNNIYGADVNYNTELPGLTRLLDRLPLIATTESSALSFTAEGAYFDPGHNKAINGGEKGGLVYIDDFEGSKTGYDLKFPFNSWSISSTPQGALNPNGQVMFPEAELFNDLTYGYNRAKLIWYSLDRVLYDDNSATPDYLQGNNAVKSSHYVRTISEKEIFPLRENQNLLNTTISTFDLAYFPSLRGPYNYERDPNGSQFSAGIDAEGNLKSPTSRWGGIMRSLEINDFEAANVEFIDFWLMDPFDNAGGTTSPTGELYINLGNVSEDILKDSRKFYEHGLPRPGQQGNLDTTVWGIVPLTPVPTLAFDTDPEVLRTQDVGYDGLTSEQERAFFNGFLSSIQAVISPVAYDRLLKDPSSDDFLDYLDESLENEPIGIIDRYRRFDGAEGNTAAGIGSDQFSHGSNIPNTEDQNRDNTLNETEEFFQYRVNLSPNMDVDNHPYITDKVLYQATFKDGTQDSVAWYHFKIPIDEFTSKVGDIQDFKSIRFIRMFMTDFQDPVVLRFAKFELTRNQWRRYQFSLLKPGEYIPPDEPTGTFFNVSTVSIEENSSKEPIPYAIPPGVEREELLGGQGSQTFKQNEAALQLQVCGLKDGDARAVYKSLNFDFRKYDRLQMFVHAEPFTNNQGISTEIQNGELVAFIRLGADFTENYYEYSIPLTFTDPNSTYNPESTADKERIWPEANKFNFLLDSLILAKKERNAQGLDPTVPYTIDAGNGRKITIVGNPDLGYVKMAMIGLENPKEINVLGQEVCGEVWVNELRLAGLNENGGAAGLVRADLKLADLGNITLSGSMHTIGFGQLEQKVNERFQDNFYQYDAATNLELGKLLPKSFGIRIPMYAGISNSYSRPEYDPYDLDVKLNDKLNALPDTLSRKDYLAQVQDFNSIKSLNFTNVRKERVAQNPKVRPWDIENWSATFAYTENFKSSPTISMDELKSYKGGLGYNFATQPKYISPFEKMIKPTSKYLRIVRDFNFNLVPSRVSFRTDVNRLFGQLVLRDVYGDALIDTSYNKDFDWNRFYDFRWDLAKSLKFDFSAVTNSQIDEPEGKINTEAKKQEVWNNVRDFGRQTNYRHTLNLNYTAPLSKIPLLDWVTARGSYGADYNWFNAVSAEAADTLGYTIQNSQALVLGGDLNMRTLYNKVGFIKKYSQPSRPQQQRPVPQNQKQPSDTTKTKQKADDTPNPVIKNIVGVITSLKRISANYNETWATTLPGFMPEVELFGAQNEFAAPGIEFITGLQPNSRDLDRFAANGWMTKVSSLSYQFLQTFNQTVDVKANFEPFQDMRLDVSWKQNYAKNFTEFFLYSDSLQSHRHLNPQYSGSYTISYLGLKTIFDGPDDSTQLSDTYLKFEALRRDVSQRLGEQNPYSQGPFQTDTMILPDYAEGYGPYSQDVLIPAFLAAYTGRDPGKSGFNILKTVPRPNWRFTYNGLNKLKPLSNIFTSVSITHGYNSTLTVGSFISDYNYMDPLYYGYPGNQDTLFGNFYSFYNIPQILLTEQFSPLIGIDVTFKNSLSTRFEFKKGRNVALSLVDYQMIETFSSEFTIGAGYRVKGLTLPFKIRGKKRTLDNDLNFRFDFSLRDDQTINYYLGALQNSPTKGALTYSISPSIDYVVNNRLNVRLYFDHKRTKPHTSLAYPISNTNAGIAIRFTLAE